METRTGGEEFREETLDYVETPTAVASPRQNTLEFCQSVGNGGRIPRGENLPGVGGSGERGGVGVEGVEGDGAELGGLKTAELPAGELSGGIGLIYGVQQDGDSPRFHAGLGGFGGSCEVDGGSEGVLGFPVSTQRVGGLVLILVLALALVFAGVSTIFSGVSPIFNRDLVLVSTILYLVSPILYLVSIIVNRGFVLVSTILRLFSTIFSLVTTILHSVTTILPLASLFLRPASPSGSLFPRFAGGASPAPTAHRPLVPAAFGARPAVPLHAHGGVARARQRHG